MSDTGAILVEVPEVPPTATLSTGDEATAGSTSSPTEESSSTEEPTADS